jgi:hypothetical protein
MQKTMLKVWGTVLVIVTFAFICQSASASQYNFVARGDSVCIDQMTNPTGTCWYFPTTGEGTYYDQPSIWNSNKSWCCLEEEQTRNLTPGTYNLLYEAPTPANGKYFKDVSWVNRSLISAFSAVHSVDERGRDGPMVLEDLKKIINSNGFNTFTEAEIVIQDPDMKITSLEQTGDITYTLRGTSNFENGTPITINIDEDRYFAQHNNSFTFHTQVIRHAYDQTGTWSEAMRLQIQDMPPGWHNATVYAGDLVASSRFKIDEREWSPAPTPTVFVNYLSNGDIAPKIVTVIQTVVQVRVEERWHTATPTPDITDALGGKVSYPYSPGDVIPGWIGIGCLCLIAAIIIMRDRKWKQ